MRPIKLTQSSIAKAKDAIIKQLDNLKLQDTKVNFTYDFAEVLKEQLNDKIKKPIVYMMASTYLKMLEYVLKCDTEIAWHGTVKRGEGDKSHIFYIKDVYLYPQKIAAATAITTGSMSRGMVFQLRMHRNRTMSTITSDHAMVVVRSFFIVEEL